MRDPAAEVERKVETRVDEKLDGLRKLVSDPSLENKELRAKIASLELGLTEIRKALLTELGNLE